MANLMRKDNAKKALEFYKSIKANFILRHSNYVMEIITDDGKIKFVQSEQSKRTFSAFAKIKSDLSKLEVPVIDRSKLRYFVHDFKRNHQENIIYNIDIKSAYATILYQDGFITEETSKYVFGLKKMERLAAIGMLAGKKHLFNYKNGEAVPPEIPLYENPLANFFYYAVERTAFIMDDLKRIAGNSYLFTWVDGIYYTNPEITAKMLDCLESYGLVGTFDTLQDFKCTIYPSKLTVHFTKKKKRHVFNLPSQSINFKTMLMQSVQEFNGSAKTQKSKL